MRASTFDAKERRKRIIVFGSSLFYVGRLK
jgi:hypothetical protein